MASLRKSERLISSRGHGCLTISLPQLPAVATRFPSHGTGRPGLELRTATKLSSAGFEPMAVLTFGLRVRRLNHSATQLKMPFSRTYKVVDKRGFLKRLWKGFGFLYGKILETCKIHLDLDSRINFEIQNKPTRNCKRYRPK